MHAEKLNILDMSRPAETRSLCKGCLLNKQTLRQNTQTLWRNKQTLRRNKQSARHIVVWRALSIATLCLRSAMKQVHVSHETCSWEGSNPPSQHFSMRQQLSPSDWHSTNFFRTKRR